MNENAKKVYDYLKQNYPDDCIQWSKTVDWKLDDDVPLKEIQMARRPGGPRELDKVKGIAQAVKDGKPMDPVVLVKLPDGTIKIADGYHRTLGFQHAGKKSIKAWIASVPEQKGAWDKEMHEKKLNIGKKAYDEFLEYVGLQKEAFEEIPIPDEIGGNIFNRIAQMDDVANLAMIQHKKMQQAKVQQSDDNSNEKIAFEIGKLGLASLGVKSESE